MIANTEETHEGWIGAVQVPTESPSQHCHYTLSTSEIDTTKGLDTLQQQLYEVQEKTQQDLQRIESGLNQTADALEMLKKSVTTHASTNIPAPKTVTSSPSHCSGKLKRLLTPRFHLDKAKPCAEVPTKRGKPRWSNAFRIAKSLSNGQLHHLATEEERLPPSVFIKSTPGSPPPLKNYDTTVRYSGFQAGSQSSPVITTVVEGLIPWRMSHSVCSPPANYPLPPVQMTMNSEMSMMQKAPRRFEKSPTIAPQHTDPDTLMSACLLQLQERRMHNATLKNSSSSSPSSSSSHTTLQL